MDEINMKKFFILTALLMAMLTASAQEREATPTELKEIAALWQDEVGMEFDSDVIVKFQDVDKDGHDEIFAYQPAASGIGIIMIASVHDGKYVAEFSDMASNNGAYEVMKDGFVTYSYSMGRHINDDFIFDDFSSCVYMKFVNSTLVYSLSYDEQLKEGVNANKVNEKNYEKSVVRTNILTICKQDIKLSDADAKKLLPTE